ncbi:50S ribosomal protein L15, chloroplastic [Apostasia shenzhenica]|uniref:50S ribosomal protein L15, chloroplastic n=1 Tax=Apostasia shenzhenica TaxID=1088818 RepID=A0A2I0AA24_9ASPA|nr:50S ribosomal protein L15, chloroplastic [Apostasia shenzhenica]
MAARISFSTMVAATSPSLRLSTPFKGNVGVLRLASSFLFFPSSASGQKLSTLSLGNQVISCRAASLASPEVAPAPAPAPARFRLNNLGPQPGSRKRNKRKGRGIAAGQGNSCGFGMRGQKSRSGPGVRKGFEGGQMPLYRRIPKLRGIAGGMHAGLPKFVPVNLKDIEGAGFKDGEEVSLETLKEKGVINPSGRERSLPLKILGDGDMSVKLSIKARSFSAAAKEKLESAGCSLTVLPGRKKWLKPSVIKNLARADEYFAKKKSSSSST